MGFYEDAINEARRREAESEEHRTRIEKERRETNERYRRAGELKLRQWFDSIGMTPHPVFTATEPVYAMGRRQIRHFYPDEMVIWRV